MPVPTSRTVLYEVRDNVAWITLNRPEALNALNREESNAIGEAFQEATSDDSVWIVVMTSSNERAFCAGADLKEMTQLDTAQGVTRVASGLNAFDEISNCLKPVIAAIDGY